MGAVNRLYTFATMPGISPDIGAKIDAELNTLFNMINGGLDDANIDGLPKIQSSKLDLGGAGYLPLIGGTLSNGAIEATLTHGFEGLWRKMGLIGTSGLVREYRSLASGNIIWGISYNTSPDGTGNWTGRDIADICLRVELTKTSDGWGGLRVYLADSLGANSLPVWNPPQHYEPMGGHSRYHNGTAWTSIGNTTDTITVDPGVSGIFNYNNIILNSGVTWNLQQGKPLIIFARESVTINGTITGDGLGALGGIGNTGAGQAGSSGDVSGGGGGGGSATPGGSGGSSSYIGFTASGGSGGTANNIGSNGNSLSLQKRFSFNIGYMGGGGGGSGSGYAGSTGGSGGNGGGCVIIISPIVKINTGGIIQCSGVVGFNGVGGSGSGGGGGGGGLIYIQAKSFINNGTLSATFGGGGTGYKAGGNGGAGVIYIEEYR